MQTRFSIKKNAEDIPQITLSTLIDNAWRNIGSFWPLKNMVAANPLQGLEQLPFEQAISKGMAYFQQPTLPQSMEIVNRQTIKWCQVFFDEGQATISMPLRHRGLYRSWKALIPFDDQLRMTDGNTQNWVIALPDSAEETIAQCLVRLNIPYEQRECFLTLLLTTLPGWSSYVKYRTEWVRDDNTDCNPISQADYLAMRIVITCLLWPDAGSLLLWYQQANVASASQQMANIVESENSYRLPLLNALSRQALIMSQSKKPIPAAQLIFCIDVRSEPFRRALEKQGNYETYGFAGFFGVPVKIHNEVSEQLYSSCPVLLLPKHTVVERPSCSNDRYIKLLSGKKRIASAKRLYQSLKYTFTAPFVLVELLGLWSGLSMLLRTLVPTQAVRLKQKLLSHFRPSVSLVPAINQTTQDGGISLEDQCVYAESALRMIGLTNHFASLVVLCGHGSTTQNNAYATALDCGACGGHSGLGNARILASILNDNRIRRSLKLRDIVIPDETIFIAAEHNTSTDEVVLDEMTAITAGEILNQLKRDLQAARKVNSRWRCQQMGCKATKKNHSDCSKHTQHRSADWAQTRPEWGLARNAAFIVGPRDLTKQLNLEGRCFLHSYDWRQDQAGLSLTTILTAPMVVAQWINSQYLFSSLDNVAYGSGSKITHNITGKIGVMQGNGSDLMHGLPLQSIHISDQQAYHQPLRLMTVVYAPRAFISEIISRQAVLQKLFGNGWVALSCIEPEDGKIYQLASDLIWQAS